MYFSIIKVLILVAFLTFGFINQNVININNMNTPVAFYIVKSDSMSPKVLKWSLLISKKAESYKFGDIVIFQSPININENIAHRIIDIKNDNGEYFVTRGDNNSTEDPWQLRSDRIHGVGLISIPFIGYVLNALRTEVGLIMLVVIPIIILVYKDALILFAGGKNLSKYVQKLFTRYSMKFKKA